MGLVKCKMRFHTNWNIFFFTQHKNVMWVINSKRATHTTFLHSSLCSVHAFFSIQKGFSFYKIFLE